MEKKILTHPKGRPLHPEARMMPSMEGEFLSYFPKIKPCIAAAKGKKRGGKWESPMGTQGKKTPLIKVGKDRGGKTREKCDGGFADLEGR